MKNEKTIDSCYGSIPHLSISKMGQQADKKISIGQENILTKKARDWKDLIIVTEKLDGSNVGVIKKKGLLKAITRRGYTAESSKYKQHHYFHDWVIEHSEKFDWLPEGWRICGEWMLVAHGTKYNLKYNSPFVVFDIIDDKNIRFDFISLIKICSFHKIQHVPLLHIGQPISIKNAMTILGDGQYSIDDKPEGIVYRCERGWNFDFMAKYVRSDKEDGKYLADEIFNEGWEESIK